jgi:hypothetical protein
MLSGRSLDRIAHPVIIALNSCFVTSLGSHCSLCQLTDKQRNTAHVCPYVRRKRERKKETEGHEEVSNWSKGEGKERKGKI